MSNMIVIPARYGSTRFPGKPLAKIAGKTLLQRVCEAALEACAAVPNTQMLVATDDERILQHAAALNVAAIMTAVDCATGSDRIIAALTQLDKKPAHVINLQGDCPLAPVNVLVAMLEALQFSPLVTPVVQLSWEHLDRLRKVKLHNPSSGTTVILDHEHNALWFSKQIIPLIRNEEHLRKTLAKSPVFQHLGIYGYSWPMLQTFAKLKLGFYEQLESLEQLRFLENGYKIKAIPVDLENLDAWQGVDTMEDALYVEQLLLAGLAKI